MNLTTARPGQSLSTKAAPNLRIRIDLSRSTPPAPARDRDRDRDCKPRKSSIEVKRGSAVVKIFGESPGPWWVAWYELRDGRNVRFRSKRHSFAKAKALAEEKAIALGNGDLVMLQFGAEDRARHLAAVSNLAGTGESLEVATAQRAAWLRKKAAAQVTASDEEILRFYVAQHPAGVITRKIPEIVTEFFAKTRISEKWRRILSGMLDRFAEQFNAPFGNLQARDIETWLDGLKHNGQPIGLRSRANYIAAIARLASYAKSREYLRKDWSALDHVTCPEPAAAEVHIYTPDELVRLLNKAETYEAGRKLVPLIAVTAFAGVRHGEMNEEKIRLLDWADFDWETKSIYIGKATAKTGNDRVVDMPENLIEWLKPYVRKSGRICELANTSNALCRLRDKAGITGPKRNALRKSFISYKTALTRNIDEVADQAGNSARVIRKNYKRVDTRMRRDAERWFAIRPTRADVLPLFTWARTA